MNYDITYCAYSDCPFKNCDRHLSKIDQQTNRTVSMADFSGTCREYIGYLVDMVGKEETR